MVATVGVVTWRTYTYDRAVRQLREAGIVYTGRKEMGLADWWRAVRANWRNWSAPFEPPGVYEGWVRDSHTSANLPRLQNFDVLANALRRVNPNQLSISVGCEALQNVDGLKGLTALEWLDLMTCTALQNVDGLKSLPSLRRFDIHGAKTLQNLDGIKGLKTLDWLTLNGCTALQNVDALQDLTSLRTLELYGCTALKNVDGLKKLKSLQALDLTSCFELRNLDALKGLTALTELKIFYCEKLPAESIAALKAALPNARIYGP
jgi:Leucine-rich repeat (LRR) protein